MKSEERVRFGVAGRLAQFFAVSKLTPLALITTIALGVCAVLLLPREEEPQIKVPMIDVLVQMPGATAQEVENRVTRPMEKLIWEISGVDYIDSTSSPGQSLVIVRYKVGTELETALVRLNQKLQTHLDRIPPGVGLPLVRSRTIDDVPVLAVTVHSRTHDQVTLRRLGAQLEDVIKALPDVAETSLIGGLRRTVRVQLDPAALASRSISPTVIASALQQANRQLQLGSRSFANEELLLEVGGFFQNIEEVGALVVGVFADRPVYLRDVAKIVDTAAEPASYVFFGSHRASPPNARPASPTQEKTSELESAVTLSVAKRPGANAVTVVENVLAAIDAVRGDLLPPDVNVTTVRDYGHTAAEKSNELLLHMAIAVFGVAILIQLFLGWRESIVVLLAIPSTLALTLLVFYLYGYTLNRITLFALIFSIGILVDDAIVVLENIIRHQRLPASTARSITQIALTAVDEVGNPTILATWAVIAAILPMAFVGGLMGPYMRPIPIGAAAAMLFSLTIAFTITPWAAIRVLRPHSAAVGRDTSSEHHPVDWLTRIYYRAMAPLLDRTPWRWTFLVAIAGLLGVALAFVASGAVKVKMLPFDNKSEFQIILNTPEGTSLEHTLRIAQEMAASISNEPEVRDYQIYAGTAAPFNFNGLVRHYFIRGGPNAADVQVNLVAKNHRAQQSHEIARRFRPRLAAIAAKYGSDVAVAEVPPGPPVLQTLVAEVYGPDELMRFSLATEIRKIFAHTEGVVDVDWYVKSDQTKLRYVVDQEKAAHHGITTDTTTRTLQIAAEGLTVGLLHLPAEREDVPLLLELSPAAKSNPDALIALNVGDDADRSKPLVPLSELTRIERTSGERDLYRKNLKPVTYVTADVADAVESPAYAMFKMNEKIKKIDATRFGGEATTLPIYHLNLPLDDQVPSLKWDGEWHITLEVFRDLGLAFAAVLILIAMLMVGWFKSYATPLVVMAAIPFSLIGILPAHWALGAFFTATSMIGFMAGAGIVVRNSIILVDFIELRRNQGRPLRDAVIEAGAVRFRPMLLTALAVVVGASVILADPIFQGLAISLMFGEIASLLISRIAVPVLYFMVNRRSDATT